MSINESRTKLQAWLKEAAVWKQLNPEMDDESVPWLEGSVDFSTQPVPESGQIRLWTSASPADGPFYGLLVAPAYGSWGVLPVSPFSSPATPEELQVMAEPPVQVVQGWNLRRIPAARAKASWCAGRLPEAEGFLVDLFLAWCGSGDPVPPALAGRVGPPLVHPLDPRHAYCDDECLRAGHSLGRDSVPGVEEGFPLARAAEPDPEYDSE